MKIALKTALAACLLSSMAHHTYSQPIKQTTHAFLQKINTEKHSELKSINNAFSALSQLHAKHTSLKRILQAPAIRNIFAPTKGTVDHSAEQAQWVMQANLYIILCHQIMLDSNEQLEQLQVSKEYWLEQLYYSGLPMITKSPFYWFNSAQYKKTIENHIEIISELEKHIYELLGIAYRGHTALANITDIEKTDQTILDATTPLYTLYNQQQIAGLDNIGRLHRILSLDKNLIRQKLDEHCKTGHFKRHLANYSTLAAAAIVGYIVYKKYEDKLPTYEVVHDRTNTWLKDYLVDPIKGLKELLWDENPTNIEPLDLKLAPINPIHFENFKKALNKIEIEQVNQENIDALKEAFSKIELDPINSAHFEEIKKTLAKIQLDPINKELFAELKNNSRIAIEIQSKFIPNLTVAMPEKVIDIVEKMSNQRINGANEQLKEISKDLIDITQKMANERITGANKHIKDTLSALIDITQQMTNDQIGSANQQLKEITHELIDVFEKMTNDELADLSKQTQAISRTLNNIIKEIDGAKQSTKLNLYLAALLPATILTYSSYWVGDKFYRANFGTEQQDKQIFFLFRKIDILLNHVANDHQSTAMQDGQLWFLTTQLQKHLTYCSKDELPLLEADIKELQRIDLSYQQKQNVMARMYQTRSFFKQ